MELRARVSYAERDSIQAHATARGESVNGFIKRAISEAMERDREGGELDSGGGHKFTGSTEQLFSELMED